MNLFCVEFCMIQSMYEIICYVYKPEIMYKSMGTLDICIWVTKNRVTSSKHWELCNLMCTQSPVSAFNIYKDRKIGRTMQLSIKLCLILIWNLAASLWVISNYRKQLKKKIHLDPRNDLLKGIGFIEVHLYQSSRKEV